MSKVRKEKREEKVETWKNAKARKKVESKGEEKKKMVRREEGEIYKEM